MQNLAAPIIIIGNGGSGSSVLDRMLGAHPGITMLGETSFSVPDAWEALSRGDANTNFRAVAKYFDADPGLEERIRSAPHHHQAFLDLLASTEYKRRGNILLNTMRDWFCLGEGSPIYWGFKEIMNGGSWRRVDWSIYDHIFPVAHWLHIIRNPFSQLVSAFRLSKLETSRENILLLLKDWMGITEMSRQRAATDRFTEIRYEDLVAAPEKELVPVLARLGLDWDGECLLPLANQWGTRSEHISFPDDFPTLISQVPGLDAMMQRYGYDAAASTHQQPDSVRTVVPGSLQQLGEGSWQLGRPFLREIDHCWRFDLSQSPIADQLAQVADDVGSWRRSPLRLYEDENDLGPAHAMHFRIRNTGKGLYCHWQRQILFSTSDNSNPNTNGRCYHFRLET